jgi:hypothetical protein
MNEREVFTRIFNDLGDTHQTMGATARLLTARGESLHALSSKSTELEEFSRSYRTEVGRAVNRNHCAAFGVLCFISSTSLGIIILAFNSI